MLVGSSTSIITKHSLPDYDDDDHDDDDDDNDPDVEDDDDPPPEQQAPSMPAADQVENIRNLFFKRHIANHHHSNSYWLYP